MASIAHHSGNAENAPQVFVGGSVQAPDDCRGKVEVCGLESVKSEGLMDRRLVAINF